MISCTEAKKEDSEKTKSTLSASHGVKERTTLHWLEDVHGKDKNKEA